MKTVIKTVFLLISLFVTEASVAQIYQHDFGTTNITAYPYNVVPSKFDANLSSSSWTNSIGTWTTPPTPNGATGKALGITLTGTSATIALTFNVAAGYYCNITSYSFWRQKSSGNGPPLLSMTINGNSVGTIPNTPNSGSALSTTTISGFTNLTGTVTIVITVSGGAAAGTFRLDDFTLNGSVTATAITYNTDYFRSTATGNWSSASTWESSTNGVSSWVPSSLVPDANAAGIFIKNGHTVTIDANASSQSLIVEAGATLIHKNGISLAITNGSTGYDFIINGTYVLNADQPSIANDGSTTQVNGLVRVDKNSPGGVSDNFARDARVWFTTGAVFQWNTSDFFETVNPSGPTLTYFPTSGSSIPIFRITANVTGIGAGNTTLWNGKFEVASGYTIKFQRNGPKVFRNGLGGSGTIYHWSASDGAAANCGQFIIGDGTTQTATIDGNLNIVIQSSVTSTTATASLSDFIIKNKTTATLSGSTSITVGQYVFWVVPNAWVIAGAVFEVEGKLINNSSSPIDLTYGRLIVSGTLDAASSGTFKCSSTFTRIISAGTSANTSVGVLKLTSSYNTVYSFEMGINASATVSTSHRIVLGTDVVVANNISLYQGVLVTDYKKLILNYTGASSLVYPSTANYKNSFIATCDQNGNALVSTGISPTTLIPYDGNVGFRINNVSGKPNYVMFPVGYNFKRPSRIALNPNTLTATNMTVVVTSGDLLNTPMPRVNRIWFVHTSDQAVNNDIGVRLYFTKYNWNVTHFGSGAGDQDEIEDGFDPTSVNAGRRDYSGDPRLSHRSAPKNVGTLDGTEAYAEYPATYLGPTTLPGYYKFGVGNFGTIILPVSIVNVKAYKNGSNINIDWSALNELNVDHYEVERSSNGVAFSSVIQTKASNNGNTQNNYSAVDTHPINGNNFYRVKAIDKDGQIKYSAVVSVNINSNFVGIKVLPNPVNNRLMNVQLSNLPAGKYDLILYSTNGQRVYNISFAFNGGFASQVIVLPPNIRTGAYVLKLFNGTSKFTQNIMVE